MLFKTLMSLHLYRDMDERIVEKELLHASKMDKYNKAVKLSRRDPYIEQSTSFSPK